MAKTIAGFFNSAADAHAAADELMADGVASKDLSVVAREGESVTAQPGGDETQGQEIGKGAAAGAVTGGVIGGAAGLILAAAGLAVPGIGPILAAGPIAAALAGAGVGAAAGGIIGALVKTGIPEPEAHAYAEGIRRGGTLVTVHATDEAMIESAAAIMEKHHAADIDRLAEGWKTEGWSGYEEADKHIPVAREELKVGKRAVGQGGVRVYSHTETTPVEQDISLREEHARVERRPTDRVLRPNEDPFKERSYEVKEMAEEPVVEKSAHVTEEVAIGKETSDRAQKIKDNLRHTEVEVQAMGGSGTRYAGPERRFSNGLYAGPERREQAALSW